MPVLAEGYQRSSYTETHTWADRLGMPGALRWGFVGLLVFMIGDGVESGYLAPFLEGRGISATQVAFMITIYGVTAGVSAWASGAMSDLFGPRKVMWVGLVIWVVFQVLLLGVALPGNTYPLMVLCYGMRGFGYPLFAYGFLVWIAASTPQNRLGTAVGWFWFAFTGGLPTLGALMASVLIPRIGAFATLWAALVIVALGGLFVLIAVRERTGFSRLAPPDQKPMVTLAASLTILYKRPKIGIGAFCRAVNTSSEYGFLVVLPGFFTTTIGFTLNEWLHLLSVIFLSNIFFNLAFGVVGDKIGWRQTVTWVGGVGSAITCLAMYYVPTAVGNNMLICMLVGVFYGATLAGFVPLSALMPSLAPDAKGAAMSALNFGAGVSAFLGPLVVTLFFAPFGLGTVMWIYAGMYLLSAVLATTLKLDKEVEAEVVAGRANQGNPIGHLAGMAGGSLLGHPPALRVPREDDDVDLVLFDVGGTLYDDDCYAKAIRAAVHELRPQVSDTEFWAAYDASRDRGTVPLRESIADAFVGGDWRLVHETTMRLWDYPADALYPDVKHALAALSQHYKLGVVANSTDRVLEAMARDDISQYLTVVALAPQVGFEKPDRRLFDHALREAGVPASRAVFVGNRLDTDVRPARAIGMRSVWMLRGEAPPAPTALQLDEPDAVITSLIGLPVVLHRLTGTRANVLARTH
ncbi:MAG TPA: RbtT/DalT/CsbX family MFS transporter [Pseudonocardia sp.]|uniref:RbtT/DalT/CsbX family MFS transporter n=1 Tax=Pseudonocardia sp. TaxID=60912 RepID=UPI002F3E7532